MTNTFLFPCPEQPQMEPTKKKTEGGDRRKTGEARLHRFAEVTGLPWPATEPEVVLRAFGELMRLSDEENQAVSDVDNELNDSVVTVIEQVGGLRVDERSTDEDPSKEEDHASGGTPTPTTTSSAASTTSSRHDEELTEHWSGLHQEFLQLCHTAVEIEEWEVNVFARFDAYLRNAGHHADPEAATWAEWIQDRREEQDLTTGVWRRALEEEEEREAQERLDQLRKARELLEEEWRQARQSARRSQARLARARHEEECALDNEWQRVEYLRKKEEEPRCFVCGHPM